MASRRKYPPRFQQRGFDWPLALPVALAITAAALIMLGIGAFYLAVADGQARIPVHQSKPLR